RSSDLREFLNLFHRLVGCTDRFPRLPVDFSIYSIVPETWSTPFRRPDLPICCTIHLDHSGRRTALRLVCGDIATKPRQPFGFHKTYPPRNPNTDVPHRGFWRGQCG